MKWETYGRLHLDNYYHFGNLNHNTVIHYDLAEDWQELSFSPNGWHRLESETDTEMLVDLFEEAMGAKSPWEKDILDLPGRGDFNPISLIAG